MKIEEYISQKHDQVALVHLRDQVVNSVVNECGNDEHETKYNSSGIFDVIASFRSQIETLQSEVYFSRGELEEEITLIKSLIPCYAIYVKYKECKRKEHKNRTTSKVFSVSKDTKCCITSKEISILQ